MDGEPESEREVTRKPTDTDLVSLGRELNLSRDATGQPMLSRAFWPTAGREATLLGEPRAQT
jgi:hypothetical protein